MKKILLFLASILTITTSFLNAPPTSAIDMEAEYFTLEDMEALSLETLEEVDELCGDNYGCRSNFLRERRERGDLYRALDVYESRKFFITAVNPNNNTIRFIYNNKLKRNRTLGRDEGEGASLVYLYIGRVEYDDHNRSPWHEMLSIVSGTEEYPEVHITFAWNTEDENRPDILPNIEYEFEMADDALLQGVRNVFYYEMKDTSNNGGRDVYRLTDCLANYQPGTECQIRFDNTGGTRYIPVTATVHNDNGSDEEENNEPSGETNPDENEEKNETSDETGSNDDKENGEPENGTEGMDGSDENNDEIADTDNSENGGNYDSSETDSYDDDNSIEPAQEPILESKPEPEMNSNLEPEPTTTTDSHEELEDEVAIKKEDSSTGYGGEVSYPKQEASKKIDVAIAPVSAGLIPNITPKVTSATEVTTMLLSTAKPNIQIVPLTPDTGQITILDGQEKIEPEDKNLPWKIGLLVAGILYVIWWFVPVGKKKRQ